MSNLLFFIVVIVLPVLAFGRSRLPEESIGSWMCRTELTRWRALLVPLVENRWLSPSWFLRYVLAWWRASYVLFWIAAILMLLGVFRDSWSDADAVRRFVGLWLELLLVFCALFFGALGRFFPEDAPWCLEHALASWLQVLGYCSLSFLVHAWFADGFHVHIFWKLSPFHDAPH